MTTEHPAPWLQLKVLLRDVHPAVWRYKSHTSFSPGSSHGPSLMYGLHAKEALEHHNRAWLTIVPGPTAEARANPRAIGQRSFRMRVLLFLGPTFKAGANGFHGGLILGIEYIFRRPAPGAGTFWYQLQPLNGGDQRGARQVLKRPAIGDADRLDIETFGLHRAEQLLNHPARAIKASDLFRIRQSGDRVRRQQPPVRWRDTGRRVDFARLDKGQRDLRRQFGGFARHLASGPIDRDLARAAKARPDG